LETCSAGQVSIVWRRCAAGGPGWLGRRWRPMPGTLWLLAFGLPLPAYLLFSSL
jgi:hypothetical protein